MTLRIRHKVLLPALAVILVLLGLATYSYMSLSHIKSVVNRLSDVHVPGTQSLRRMRVLVEQIVQYGQISIYLKEDEKQKSLETVSSARRDLEAELANLVGREPKGPQPEHRRFSRAMQDLYDALQQMTPEDNTAVLAAAEQARARLADLEEFYAERVRNSVDELARIGGTAARSTLYALVAGLLVSVVVWVLILWSLSRPLRNLVEGTERVAQGRFDEPIPVASSDELGTLSDAFNRMAASLSELDRMKAEFVATASHELKTPLACIKGFATLLKSGSRGPLTEEQRSTLAQIEEQADQMAGFVSQLLDLSRMRAGRLSMNMRSLPAEAYFSTVGRGFDGVAERRGIRYEMRLAPDLPARIVIDPDRLREVVYNLLGNAFKFTETGGRVGLEVEAEAGWIRLTVTDTGPGIAQEDLPYIFEKYYRGAGRPDDARVNEGAGLGLAISRGIVEKHGGRIWAESTPGRGSKFVIRIPAGGGAGPGQADGTRTEPPSMAAKET